MIAQFRNAKTGRLVTGTNSSWQCFVLHHGPIDESCADESNPVAGAGPCAFNEVEEPEGWKSADNSGVGWKPATTYTVSKVRPKDGYDRIDWDDEAALIWSDDLRKDNTVLFRIVIGSPPSSTGN